MVLLQELAELLVGRNYAPALVVLTPAALLMGQLAAPLPPSELSIDREVETEIGVVIGVLVTWSIRSRATRVRCHLFELGMPSGRV